MAVTLNASTAAGSRPCGTCTISLTSGWDQIPPERGGRPLCAGDLVILMVRKPTPPVAGPPGWTLLGEIPWTDEEGHERTGTVFWKFIGPPEREIPPMFTADRGPWEVCGQALSGVAPIGDGTGNVVSSLLPL